MIKRLICFLMGHILDHKDIQDHWKEVYRFYDSELNGSRSEYKRDIRYWCNRCQTYRRV